MRKESNNSDSNVRSTPLHVETHSLRFWPVVSRSAAPAPANFRSRLLRNTRKTSASSRHTFDASSSRSANTSMTCNRQSSCSNMEKRVHRNFFPRPKVRPPGGNSVLCETDPPATERTAAGRHAVLSQDDIEHGMEVLESPQREDRRVLHPAVTGESPAEPFFKTEENI